MAERSQLPAILRKHEQVLLNGWAEEQRRLLGAKVANAELKTQCQDFLRLLTDAAQSGDPENVNGPAWEPVKRILAEISRNRGLQGFTPSETATFVFSLKLPLFKLLRNELEQKPQEFANET